MRLVGGLTSIAILAKTALSQATDVCQPPTDHSIKAWTKCANDPNTGYERWIGYGIFQTRVNDAYAYCQRLKSFYQVSGKMNLVSIPASDMDTCVNGLLTTVASETGSSYPAVASLGARFYNKTEFANLNQDKWAWADDIHEMTSGTDYNNCDQTTADGICQAQSDQQCLVADASGSNYNWKSFSCTDSHVNFMCEYTCNPNVNPVDEWPPQPPHPPCWWCDKDTPGYMQQMVGFVGNTSSDPTIYVQEQNMTVHQLSLPQKADGTNPQFPYIAYNPFYGAFEVVGSFNQDKDVTPNGNGNGSYHFTVDFMNNNKQIMNSNYDSRSYSSLVYVPDVNNTIFVGGYPPNVDNDYQYSRVVSRPLIYSTVNQNSRFTLPSSWPSSYHCNGSPDTCKVLSFPQTTYHAEKLFVVGGSSYAYCPQPNYGANNNIWTLKFDPSYANTGNELQWTVLTNLNTAYGTCRGVMAFDRSSALNILLTTTLNYVDTVTSFTGFEAINYAANTSYPQTSATAFAQGNDMPVQFATLATSSSNIQSWNVMGGAMRTKDNNLATIYGGETDKGFQTSTTPNFPNSLYGLQLLGTTLSNEFAAPLYYPDN